MRQSAPWGEATHEPFPKAEAFAKQPDGDARRRAFDQTKRDQELQHLSVADAHIAHGERVASRQMAKVKRLRSHGHDTALAEETLIAFETNLRLMRKHRDEIVRTIAEIDRETQRDDFQVRPSN